MIEEGVRIRTRMKILGCAIVVGEERTCLRLKERVEAEKFAGMSKINS